MERSIYTLMRLGVSPLSIVGWCTQYNSEVTTQASGDVCNDLPLFVVGKFDSGQGKYG